MRGEWGKVGERAWSLSADVCRRPCEDVDEAHVSILKCVQRWHFLESSKPGSTKLMKHDHLACRPPIQLACVQLCYTYPLSHGTLSLDTSRTSANQRCSPSCKTPDLSTPASFPPTSATDVVAPAALGFSGRSSGRHCSTVN